MRDGAKYRCDAALEQRAEQQGKSLSEMTLAEMDGYWNEAKEIERK